MIHLLIYHVVTNYIFMFMFPTLKGYEARHFVEKPH